jgi:hypothetical protein
MKKEFLMKVEWWEDLYNGISFTLFINGEFAHGELLGHKNTLPEYQDAYNFLNGLLGGRNRAEFGGDEFERLSSYLPKDYTYLKHKLILSFIRKKKIQRALKKLKGCPAN